MKTTINLLFITFILVAIFSCTNTENKKVANPDSIVDQLPDLAIKPDTFHIQPQQTRAVRATNKTFIIQENSFLYEDGSPVTEPIIIKIKSFDMIGDMILNNLQTISSKGILETAGMFELEAKTESGKKVQINPKQPLQLLAPAPKQPKSSPFELYGGKKNDLGKISWENPKPSVQLGPIPFEVLFYWRTKIWVNMYSNFMFDGVGYDNQISKLIQNFDLVKYQNTSVATPEFVEKTCVINNLISKVSNQKSNFDSTFQLLSKSADLTIKAVDSIVLLHLAKAPMLKADSFYIKKFNLQTNQNTNLSPAQNILVDTAILRHIQQNGYNPDWPNKTAEERALIKKIRAQWLPIIYARYTCTEVSITDDSLCGYPNSLSYFINQLGWHNIDRLLDENNSQESISVSCLNSSSPVTFVLVLKKERIVLSKQTKTATATFTAQLPKHSAYLIAISIQDNNQLFLAKKEILIGQNKEEQLELKPVTAEELEKALADIEEGYTNKN